MTTSFKLTSPVVFDIESYPNYFLVSFKRLGVDGVKSFETSSILSQDEQANLRAFCARRTLIGYFSSKYDMVMLAAAVNGWPCKRLKWLSDQIISTNRPTFMIMRDNGLYGVKCRAHIDLSNSLGWFPSGLKTIACRIGYDKVQDLPYKPDMVLDDEQKYVVKKYCENDLGITEALYNWPPVTERIEQRVETATKRDEPFDWMNGGDVRIAEQMIKYRTGVKTFGKKSAPDEGRCRIPGWVKFDDDTCSEMAKFAKKHKFNLSGTKIALPKELNRDIDLNGVILKFGVGGIHSKQKRVFAEADDYLLYDIDVSSYYPNLIVQLGIDPPSMGGKFKGAYPSILKERLAAKNAGDLTTASVMKLVANSVYGKMGSPYSIMYDPYALASVTFSGQFGMLMLIEYLHRVGVIVISSNTDSVTCCFHKDRYDIFMDTCKEWCVSTSLELDYDSLKAVYYRDVNNYLRIYSNDEVKGKGIFMKAGPRKAPYPKCITDAVVFNLQYDIPIEDTIHAAWDPNDFCHSRNIKARAIFRDELLGKSPRWVWQKGSNEYIRRVTDGSKVPLSDGCKPLMNLADEFDPDYERYIAAAYKLHENVTETRIC